MGTLNQDIENHYLKKGLFEKIIKQLEKQGVDLNDVGRKDIAGVDEFHVRGATVSKELAKTIDLKGLSILDVGCGLGGPCRMLADEYGCAATGIDLSAEFVRTAKELSKLVKLDHKTRFFQGDATELPFKDNAFDAVWTQHVQMNVPDKEKLYSEIHRVLRVGGHFLFYDIFKKGGGQVAYPMPWASKEEQSFLFKHGEMDAILVDLGFKEIQSVNQTEAGIAFFDSLFAKLKDVGPPKVGLNILMGESTGPKLMNLMNHLKDNVVILVSGAYQKK